MKRSRKSKSRPKKKEKAKPDPGVGLLTIFLDEITSTDACVNIRAPNFIIKNDIQKYKVS